MIKRIKIFHKFLIIMLFLSAVPLAIVGWRLININRLGLQDVILELHTNQALSIAESIETYMKNLKEKVKFIISSQGDSATINWSLSQRILKSMIASSSEFFTISAVSNDGRELTKVYHPSLEGRVKLEDHSNDKTFIRAKESGTFTVSNLYYENSIPKLNLIYPFTQDIFLYIEASLKELLEKVKNTNIGSTGFAYIVNKDGNIIMHPDVSKALNFISVADRPIVKEVLSRRLVGSKEYTIEEGKTVVGAYAPVAALNWGVIIQQDKDEAYLSARMMRQNALILLIAVVLIASVIGYLMAQNLTGPILKLTNTARNIAAGNFEVDKLSGWLKKIKIKDELTELSHTFIIMTHQLKKYTDMQADKINAILFSIADGIIMADYSGRVILSNRKAKELLGIDISEKLEDKNIRDIIKRGEISVSLKEVIETKETIVKEIDLSHDNNLKFLRTDTSLVSHSESGRELGTVTVIRDITFEKEIEGLKEDFIHSITHDLRSPMTAIRGFLEFLLDGSAGEINEQQKEFLEIIDNSSGKLLGMINDILDVAKLDSGTMPVEIVAMDIFDTAKFVADSLMSQAKKDKINLQVVKESELKELHADKNLIHRVLTNLVSNALKFTPENGEIKILLLDTGDKIQITVSDTGRGMPEEYLDKIFDKFQQVTGSEGRSKGTGLGLTITKQIVELHKGKIWVESELNRGSKFIFWIPRGLQVKETKRLGD